MDSCVFGTQLQAESIQQQQGLFVKLSAATLLLLLLLHHFPKGRISASHPAEPTVCAHCNVITGMLKTSSRRNEVYAPHRWRCSGGEWFSAGFVLPELLPEMDPTDESWSG